MLPAGGTARERTRSEGLCGRGHDGLQLICIPLDGLRPRLFRLQRSDVAPAAVDDREDLDLLGRDAIDHAVGTFEHFPEGGTPASPRRSPSRCGALAPPPGASGWVRPPGVGKDPVPSAAPLPHTARRRRLTGTHGFGGRFPGCVSA